MAQNWPDARFVVPPQVLAVLREQARLHGVTVQEILSGMRNTPIVEARRATAAYLRKRGMSLPQIARYLRRHHSSIHAMLKRPVPKPGRRSEIPVPDLSGEWAI